MPPSSPGPPNPFEEIRLVGLTSVQGINFWSRYPVTRIDLAVGRYDDVSSADVPGFTEALVELLPGLWEHRCSVGERGGFVTRLRRGTYAPHIVEHVAIELQSAIGHRVGYGRARPGDRPGEYTTVVEHRHEAVGKRAAALALEIVQRGFAGVLQDVRDARDELSALARAVESGVEPEVCCGISGAGDRCAARRAMRLRGWPEQWTVADVSPAYLLNAGLPYARSRAAVILGTGLVDVPPRYREEGRESALMGVLIDAVAADGWVIVPAGEIELQEYARDAGCRLAVFAPDGSVAARAATEPDAVGSVVEGRIVLEHEDRRVDAGPLAPGADAGAQVAAALAVHSLQAMERSHGD